ncbi:hypothetical protein BDD12DRAFT_826986 [Trichophaea hybrida]|nr:hypothetical protein BDD12DRAFT_826986 [Trichophaea hybrida]
MFMEFGNNTVDIPQDYQVDALYIPMIQLSLLLVNQTDSAGYRATFRSSKCSISLTSSP